MQSLHSFCTQHEIPKTTVKRWLNDNGFDTSQGMSPEAIAAAKAHFRIADPQPEPTATTVIEVGNHRGTLALPNAPALIDLGQYRGENAALSSFQPEDIERFLMSCDGFLDAVEKEASLIYKMRSESIALHNATLDQALQRDMATLGKPQQPAESPQP